MERREGEVNLMIARFRLFVADRLMSVTVLVLAGS